VNCVGEVIDDGGRVIAGARGVRSIHQALLQGRAPRLRRPSRENTTIGLVATDAALTKVEANRIASIAHDGLARAIRPAHTRYDGDTIFAASTRGTRRLDLEVLAAAAVEVTAEAIRRAVR
jgi:L-aminopeptidase/D-esterase-like protein